MKAQIGPTRALLLSEPRVKYAYIDGKRSTQIERDPVTNVDIATARVAASTPFGLIEAMVWLPTGVATTLNIGAAIEMTGSLEMEVVGGDFGSTRNTIRGVEGAKVVGDFDAAFNGPKVVAK